MAAPADMTARNLSGKFALNKEFTKNDELLKAQGVSWMLRKTIGAATPRLTMTHTVDDAGMEHIALVQGIGKGGEKVNERALDGVERENEGALFGKTADSSSRKTLAEVSTCKWLAEGWLEESFLDGKIIHVRTKGESGWTMEQTWGFQTLGGKKLHVRKMHMVCAKGEVVEGLMVYNYGQSLMRL
ncbi:uncharacterized protein BXZ73DRAFT_44703 [Epithele typhae]|uniref:uncharacterized protein n=1 Tax=Epithele typhae TaxID=378194 RepID=UPI0020072E16|nr:uncharacterized protein BXZ73DRAFT_44703 [Epithele typhae]KAH9937925.1 hypothetical protein BXZ73DRAFT_44703 [Epithele typhae]